MIKNEVLQTLIDSDDYVSGQTICDSLGVSRTAVWKAIESLREEGFNILSKTNQGYKLVDTPNILIEELILPYLKTQKLGRKIICLETVDSTNNYLKSLASEGALEGTVVISEEQTSGKGRLGRAFESPKGKGLYMSVLLRPDFHPSQLASLTSVIAMAVSKAIEKISGIETKIKWVNDIIAHEKKICGILTEMSVIGENSEVDYVVVGMGVNVSQNIDDFSDEILPKASSLSLLGSNVSRANLAAEMLNTLDEYLRLIPSPGKEFWDEYRERSITLGRQIKVKTRDELKDAFAQDIDENGALIIRFPDGTHDTISYGEVSIRGKYGYV